MRIVRAASGATVDCTDDFLAMPILADALEEAGCDHADILTHCREPGVHVRGCWVVDLVLGKEVARSGSVRWGGVVCWHLPRRGSAMPRLAVGVCLVLAVTAALAAPVPKDFTPPNYYPTALGSVWEYAVEGEKEVALAVKVTEVREKDGVRVVRLEQTAGPKSRDYPEEILIDTRGVHLAKAADKEIEPPRLDLKPTPKAGEEWDGPHEWRGTKYACTTTVGDAEKVVVPAGAFTALPHTQTYPDSGPVAWTAWYAPGVGRVKFKNYEEKVHVLLKFTPGKDKESK